MKQNWLCLKCTCMCTRPTFQRRIKVCCGSYIENKTKPNVAKRWYNGITMLFQRGLNISHSYIETLRKPYTVVIHRLSQDPFKYLKPNGYSCKALHLRCFHGLYIRPFNFPVSRKEHIGEANFFINISAVDNVINQTPPRYCHHRNKHWWLLIVKPVKLVITIDL